MTERDMREDMAEKEKKDKEQKGAADSGAKEQKKPAYEEISARIEELEKDIEEKNDQLLRMAAEMENFKKRLEREKEDFLKFANKSLARDLLQVVDGLDRALEHSRSGDTEAVFDGVKLTRTLLLEILEKYGVERFSAQDQPFDPERHEALNQLEVEKKENDGLCVQEYQTGYTMKGKLLRPSRVAVGRYTEEPGNEPEENAGSKINVRVNK